MKSQLNDRQMQFIARCETSDRSMREELSTAAVSSEELSTWLSQRAFIRAVNQMRKRLEFIRELEIQRGAVNGAKRLTKTTMGAANGAIKLTSDLRACVQLCRLARFVVRRGKRPVKVPAGLAYHPSISPDEAAKLLAVLSRHSQTEDRHA